MSEFDEPALTPEPSTRPCGCGVPLKRVKISDSHTEHGTIRKTTWECTGCHTSLVLEHPVEV